MGGLADRLAATMGSRRQPTPYRWTSDRPVASPEGRVFGRPGNRQTRSVALDRRPPGRFPRMRHDVSVSILSVGLSLRRESAHNRRSRPEADLPANCRCRSG